MISTAHRGLEQLVRARPPRRPPVLVTGNGRSGTSWVGETLGRAPGVQYHREPCHPGPQGLRGPEANQVWSRYVPAGGHDDYFARTLSRAFSGVPGAGSSRGLRDLPHRLLVPPRIVVKEVASFLSLEWVWERWQPEVLILVRHPAAYVASVRALDQDADELERFVALRSNTALRRVLPAHLLRHIDSISDPLAATTASWAIRNAVNLRLVDGRPRWQLIRYEEVATDPVAAFSTMYERCGLEFLPGTAQWIRERSTTSRPGAFATARVSSSRIDAWRSMLSVDEVARIRRTLEPFELTVYDAGSDW